MSMFGKSPILRRRISLLSISIAVAPILIFPLNTTLAQDTVGVVRLGQPDVQIGSRYVGKEQVANAASDLFSAAATVTTLLLKQMQVSARPTALQWNQAAVLGLSQEPALAIRGQLNPTKAWATAAKNADVWFTLKPTPEGNYELEGAFDLEAIANNGLLTESLATLAIDMAASNDDKQAVHGLWKKSSRIKLATVAALIQLDTKDTDEDIEFTTTFRLSRLGVSVDTQTFGFWNNLWTGVKETTNCYNAAIGDFVQAHGTIGRDATCSTSECNFTFKGEVSGQAAQALMSTFKACING